MINLQQMDGNITCLSFESRETSVNLITEPFLSHLETLIEEIIRNKDTQGIIFTSGKKDFLLGADLNLFLDDKDPVEIYQLSRRLQKIFRELETWGKPVVSALSGSALGAGMELALACHYRVAINHRSIVFGFPEVKIGLMPGGGGSQRLMRLIGIEKALPLLMKGSKLDPVRAKELGLVDSLVETKNELLEKAVAFIQQNPNRKQFWEDQEKWQDPLCPLRPAGQKYFMEMAVKVQKDYLGHGVGPQKILSCLYEGSLLGLESACQIEAQSFSELFKLESSQKMIQTLFFGVSRCRSIGQKKIQEHPPIHSVGIIGAGLMGRGIAHTAASTGHKVHLLDKDISTAEMGRNLISKELDKLILASDLSTDGKSHTMEQIKATDDWEELSKCDIIIEAIDENVEHKREVYKKLEEVLTKDKVIITNTSSLPLEVLNKEMENPDRLVGLHFFAPVLDSPLVEIVKAKVSSQKSLVSALKLANTLQKVPIVVRDGYGFFTTRVMVCYISEAILCLNEGIPAALIENAGIALGLPIGPLALADNMSLSTIDSLLREKLKVTRRELEPGSDEHLVLGVLEKFLHRHLRLGVRSKKGFYDYEEEGHHLSELTKSYEKEKDRENPVSLEDIKNRLMNIQLVETMKCFEEGVLNTAHEGDVASILGWGFPPETGGIVSNCHKLGNEKLLEELNKMSIRWGERFSAPKILKTLINKNFNSLHEAREILANALLEDS